MEQKLIHFFLNNHIQPTDIMYACREDRKTSICLKDGRKLETYIPMKWLITALPDGAYLHINKGVIVAASHISHISGRAYTMADGRVFEGRVRTTGVHNTNRKILEHTVLPSRDKIDYTIYQQFSMLDNMPLPICVVELIVDTDKHDIDFIFRYCNDALASMGNLPRETLIDRSCQDVFRMPEKEWVLAFTDTALRGKTQMIDMIQPLSGNPMQVHLFQPAKNLCACVLIESNH
ncbi:MAG: LytTR family transcriptional regulator DNA-binding domain-containing protein [Firmicutes bacterium]|nr:LytTR family transcriptional regulator DNA-binding domain-containing protein [Bacillota bacterium]